MFGIEQISQLTENIYDAALDAGSWMYVLGHLAQSFGASSAHLSRDKFSMEGEIISYGSDPAYAKSYADYFASRNVLWKEMVRRSLYDVMTNRIVMPVEDLRRTEFYNDYLRPQDGEEILVSVPLRQPDAAVSLTLWRPERSGAWEIEHVEAIAALTPHLRRALQANQYIGDLQGANELASEALHRLERGVVLIGAQQQVLFANRAAESMFARGAGLDVERGRLKTSRAPDDALLERLIAHAINNGVGSSMVIAREARPALIVLAMPLGAEKDPYNGQRPRAVVFIKDLERAAEPSLATFARHFGLTPAQTALAREMNKGDGVASAAARLGIAYATARTHLVQIFQKTQTRRQAELVRLMLAWDEG